MLEEMGFWAKQKLTNKFNNFICKFNSSSEICAFEEKDQDVFDFILEQTNYTKECDLTNKFFELPLKELVSVFFTISSRNSLKRTSKITYLISAPKEVKRHKNRALSFLCRQFLCSPKKKKFSHAKHFIDPNKWKRFLMYPLKERIEIYLNEPNLSEIECFVGFKRNGRIFRISEVSAIKIGDC